MRHRMMPTAKKKLAGIGMFMRQPDGSVAVPGSPRRGDLVGGGGLPATPAPNRDAGVAASGTSHVQLQPPPEIASRLDIANAARLQAPRTGRYAASISGPPTTAAAAPAGMSPPQQHFHPMQRTRTTASEHGGESIQSRNGNIWAESPLGSMLDSEPESRIGFGVFSRPNPNHHGRHYSEAAPIQQRPHASQLHRVQAMHNDQKPHTESVPLMLSEDGILKIVANTGDPNRPSATTLNTSRSSNLLQEQLQNIPSSPYQSDREPYDNSPPSKLGLRRTKLPHRDARETKRNSFSDRVPLVYPQDPLPDAGLSPERSSEAGEQLERVRFEEKARRRQQLELEHKRSTVFENLEPIEDHDATNFNNTRAAVGLPSTDEGTEVFKEGLETPRAAVPRHTTALQNALLQESVLERSPPRKPKEASKKRPRTPVQVLDYNDAELHSMSYSNLRAQAFDYDPQAAALQQPAQPSLGTMEEKLQHYRGSDSITQHQFFTQLSVDEWEDAGDWFLEQFTSVVSRMKTARKQKRALVQRFETEIAAREEAVRGKIEGIERTLEDLKQEGQTMMQGKDTDLEF